MKTFEQYFQYSKIKSLIIEQWTTPKLLFKKNDSLKYLKTTNEEFFKESYLNYIQSILNFKETFELNANQIENIENLMTFIETTDCAVIPAGNYLKIISEILVENKNNSEFIDTILLKQLNLSDTYLKGTNGKSRTTR